MTEAEIQELLYGLWIRQIDNRVTRLIFNQPKEYEVNTEEPDKTFDEGAFALQTVNNDIQLILVSKHFIQAIYKIESIDKQKMVLSTVNADSEKHTKLILESDEISNLIFSKSH